MTELITDHAYERGPYGRCKHATLIRSDIRRGVAVIKGKEVKVNDDFSEYGTCNKRKAAHGWAPPQAKASHNSATIIETPLVAPVVQVRTFPTEHATVLRFKVRGRVNLEEVELDWPEKWPYPAAGQIVRVGDNIGHVRDVTFDLDRRRLIVACE